MTQFYKPNFSQYCSGNECWLSYLVPGEERARFVGRFKYLNKAAQARHFRDFVAKHMTVEEFFPMRDDHTGALGERMTALGFVPFNTAKLCKERGYPCTPKGAEAMIRDQVERSYRVVMEAKSQAVV